MRIPLDDSQILNVKDEYALVMDIWHELERLANNYMQKCADIQNNHKNAVDKMNSNHSSQRNNLKDSQSQRLKDLDNNRQSKLEAVQTTYEQKKRRVNDLKDSALRDKQTVKSNTDQFREDTMNQINQRRTRIENYLRDIDEAEAEIVARRYKRIAKDSTPLADMNATTIDQIMGINPHFVAKEVNDLNEKMLQKLIRPAVLRSKCIEFYTLKVKAKELYQKDFQEQSRVMPDTERKISAMLGDAETKYKNAIQSLNADDANAYQRYSEDTLQIEDDYNQKKRQINSDYSQAEQRLNTAQANEKTNEENAFKSMLIKALQDYQAEQLMNLPPKVLKSFVDSVMAKKITSSRNFAPSSSEPLNVSIGYIYFKFEQFLNNKLVDKFMTSNYGFILKSGAFVFPYTIAINESFAYCFKYSNKSSEIAKQNMQTICLNAFLKTPPNKMRFHFIDPLKTGQSFALFKHFEEENSSSYNIILGGIQTEANSIERELQVVVDHIKDMQVNTFKGQYKNIREYNEQNTLNPQPYNILGIMDFPAGFTPKAIDLLGQVVATGKECGVYVVLMENEEQVANVDAKLFGTIKNIEDMCKTFQYAEPGYVYVEEGRFDNNIRYMIEPPLKVQEIVEIAPVMKQGIKDAGRIIIDYAHIAPRPETYLKYNTNEGISIPIGMSGASDIQKLNLGMPGSQSVHALICGQIGSGKSRLLHAIITGALLQYPKNELAVYLVDFKSGTEFKIYADYNLPNFNVIAIESEQEFGLSVLRSLKREAERRAQIFNDYTVSDITSYNNGPGRQNGEKLPRVLIVIDEFHMMFSGSNTDVTKEAAEIMDGILRLDRSYGFHMVLCSQSIRGMSAINEAALAQIAVRIALKCPKEDADIVLKEGSDAIQQIEENDAGSAIYLPAISSPRVNNKFRVGFLSPQNHTALLSMLDGFYTKAKIRTDARVLVSDVSDSRNSLFQRYVKDAEILAKDRIIHVGEPLKVDAKMEIRFDALPGNNMLLLGKNAQKAQNILFFITYDLLLQKINQERLGRKAINITVINYCDGANVDIKDRLQEIGLDYTEYCEGSIASVGIQQIFDRFEHKNPGDPDDWLIISHLGLASDLQTGSIYNSNNQNALKFERLLKEGPSKGVFVVAWCDEPALYRSKYQSTFEFFGKRIVFNVSPEDATAYADIIKDESINKNNAYVYQNGKGNEKFRPYSTPTDKWIKQLKERLDGEL